MSEEAKEAKEKKSIYHLDLEPGKEQRRPEWNLILVSDVSVGVDFYHTDMIEKVISIRGKNVPARLEEEVKG
jgi:hypothetical protein